MSSDYVIHKFKAGDLLYAHQMREIDDGIHRALQQSEQNAIAISNIKTALATAGLSVDDVQAIIQNTAIAASQIIMNSEWADGLVRLGKDSVTKITNDSITTDTVIARLVQADEGQFSNLTADSALIRTVLRVGEAGITEITEDTISTAQINADNITVTSAFVADVLQVGESGITTIADDTITTANIFAKIATVDVLNSQLISANSAFITSLQSLSSTAATSVITDAYIQNAIIGKVTAAQLKAGDIVVSDQVRIVSANNALVMNGSALQIYGKDSQNRDYVGIQIGYDTSSQPSIIVRNEDGATVLTPAGITENAIADGLIINDMVRPGTLSKDRLGFSVMETGDHVLLSQIYDGDTAWGAQYTSFKNDTESALSDLSDDVSGISTYALYIETPDGVNVRGGNIRLIVHLFKNNIDVTSSFDSSCFVWTKKSSNSASDASWNTAHSTGTKTLTLNGTDVAISTNFECHFTYTDTNNNTTHSYASVNIVDYSDVGTLNSYLVSSHPSTVVFNPNTNTYTPNWQASNLTIRPVITYNGNPLTLTATGLTIAYTKKDGSGSATALDQTGESVSNGVLTVSANKIASCTSGILTYICTIAYVDPYSGISIVQEESVSFSLLSGASEVKYAYITGENAFLYDTTGALVGSDTITLSADIQIVTISKWKYLNEYGNYVDFPTTYNNSITGTTLNVKESETGIWRNNKTATIKLVTSDPDVYDIHQIIKIADGAAGTATISAVLSNQSHYVPCDANGNVLSWNGAATEIHIYVGGIDDTANWNISPAVGNGLNGTYSNGVFTPTSLTEATSYVDFTCTKNTSTLTLRYTITKSKSGADGKNAEIYELVPGTYVLNLAEDGTFSPTGVTFHSYKKVGDAARAAYSGRFKVYESTDGTNYVEKSSITSTADEYSKTCTPSSTSVVAIKAELYAAGGFTTLIDDQTVVVTRDGISGENGLSVGLINTQDIIPCNSNGTAAAVKTLTIPFYAYLGIERVAVTATINTSLLPSGVSLTSNTAGTMSSNGQIVLSVASGADFGSASALTGTITITLSCEGQTIDCPYVWTKNLKGQNGQNASILQIYSEDGGIIRNSNGSTTLKVRYVHGGDEVTPTSVQWYKFQTGSYTAISGATSTSLTVTANMVDDDAFFKAVATYGGVTCNAFYTVDDLVDSINAECFSTVTDFKNGEGCGAVYTRIFRPTGEIDPLVTTVFSTEAPTSPSTNDYYYFVDSVNKTVILKKYNGSAWVNASENYTYTYKYYRVDADGNALDTTTPYRTARCIYVDSEVVGDTMQFICEVSE